MTSWVSCFIAPNSPCEKLRAKTRENATHRNETNLRAIRTASPPPVPSLFWTREILRIFRKYRLLVLRVLSAIVHRDHNRRGSDENRPSSLLLNEREKEKLVSLFQATFLFFPPIFFANVTNIQKVVEYFELNPRVIFIRWDSSVYTRCSSLLNSMLKANLWYFEIIFEWFFSKSPLHGSKGTPLGTQKSEYSTKN